MLETTPGIEELLPEIINGEIRVSGAMTVTDHIVRMMKIVPREPKIKFIAQEKPYWQRKSKQRKNRVY